MEMEGPITVYRRHAKDQRRVCFESLLFAKVLTINARDVMVQPVISCHLSSADDIEPDELIAL
jgi:hypothetical protein